MKFLADARHLPADSALAQTFARHDDELHSGFITRLDRTPASRKRLLFVRSLIYNFAILTGSMTLAVAFISRSMTINIPQSLRLTFIFTQGLLLLWAISVLLISTTFPFFLGECRLRWKYGFKPTEVVVRQSPPEESTRSSDHRTTKRHWHAALRAIDPTLVYSNPVSILSRDFWVMEHTIILDIYASMESGRLNEDDLEFTIWKECDGLWLGLELWKLQSIVSDQQEVSMFKAFLSNKDQDELLSTWERLHDSTAGRVLQSPEKYQSMVKRFSQEGIDYDTVWSQIQKR
ncbi:hypothetical protein AN958_09894 [Leucoagaricus sp. SymC.cos]|nr:hypothetical protein AN958_09894 [Leucoagaricus sp. SymC.cos]